MVKNLKRKHINKEYDKNDKEKKILKKNKKSEDELQLEEDDNIISSKTSNISDEKLNEIIKNLKEKGLYYDDLDDFLKNDSMDGVHCSRDDKGQLVMHVKAEKPQDAMDKLHEYGFISEEERDLFKQRFDYLESKGVDVSQIKGGDLNNLRDDKLFEQYEKEMMEKYGPNSPVKGNAPDVQIGNPNEPKVLEPNSEQKDVQDEVEVVNPNEFIETDIFEGPSDEELLRKFEQVQNEVGLDNKPDVSIGRDREMGD